MKKNFFFVLSSLLMFTVGMYAQSETSVVMKDSFAVKGANYLPEGWIVCAGGNIKATGAAGIVKPDKNNIQIIYGPKVEQIANSVKSIKKTKN